MSEQVPALGARVASAVQPLPLSVADWQRYDTIIDTRTPAEFALDHLPGAINCPVLDDQQRIEVGTLYAQSPFAANKLGAALVARNIAWHLENTFATRERAWQPLIYCWRGGKRSAAMTHILRAVGWKARQLEGGYKAWRGQVRAELATLPGSLFFRIVCGRTGSGKSRLLSELAAVGEQVLDLEQLANHRGSVLGGLPGAPQPSQKWFEGRIWMALSGFATHRPIWVEAESRRVGALRVPEALLAAMWTSPCVRLDAPLAARVALLCEDYAHFIDQPDLLCARLDSLNSLHSREITANWQALIKAGDWPAFVRELLTRHYDPAYERSMLANYRRLGDAQHLPVDDLSMSTLNTQALALRAQNCELAHRQAPNAALNCPN